MNNFKFLLLLAVLTIVGCTQEEELAPETNEKLPFEFVQEDGFIKVTDFDNSNVTTTVQKNNGNSSHAHGNYDLLNPQGIVYNYDFSMTENNGGTHGSGVITVTDNTAFPLLPLDLKISFDTYCVRELDNGSALIAGIVTEVENGFFEEGNVIVFQVIDNGQGKNAASDQAYNQFITFIGGTPSCELLANFIPGQTIIELLASLGILSLDDIGNNAANMQSPYKIKVN